MRVTQVTDTVPLKPNEVYVIPPGRRLEISDTAVSALAFDEPRGRRTPIDLFLLSLADQQGDGFAVVLTGGGSDGSVGVKAVKETGGIILVQDPEEAEYPSMPRAAIATGVADLVLPIREIAARLAELIPAKIAMSVEEADEASLRRVLNYVRARTGHDFSKYKRTTVLRRVVRRIQVTRCDGVEAYDQYLRENADEVESLFNDLLISVTTFFRDPDAYNALAKLVVPRLFDGEHADKPLRVWSAGCATGEEAYSLAMLLYRGIRPPRECRRIS